MESLFAVRMTYDENMFYNQVLASRKKTPVVKKEQKFNLPQIQFSDGVLGVVAFAIFFTTFHNGDMATRILQAVLMSAVFVYVMKQMNGKKRAGKDDGKKAAEASERDQARMILESSGRAGERCTVMFGEDGFQVDSPGIVTMYRYEGVAWIKETAEYYMIFWNRSMVIPVEKAGFFKGRPEQFKAFLEKKCQKTIERVKVAVS